jgi:glycine cleavage system H protein
MTGAPLAAAVSEIPKDLRYSASHEWVRVEGDEATIGITDHAQEALNDIVFVELPRVGDLFHAEDEFGVVESVKSVSELYLPLAGEVLAVNDALEDAPETLNDDPYGAGWLVKIKIADHDAVENLLTPQAYRDEIGAS